MEGHSELNELVCFPHDPCSFLLKLYSCILRYVMKFLLVMDHFACMSLWVWLNSICRGSAHLAEVCHWILYSNHCSPLTFTNAYWTFLDSKQQMTAQRGSGGAFQQWQQPLRLISTGTDLCEWGMQALVHWWLKCIAEMVVTVLKHGVL